MTASCSDYLQAQACSVNNAGIDNAVGPFSTTWISSFGRSPECTAFAQQQGLVNGVPVASLIGQCNNASKSLHPIAYYAPWGVLNAQIRLAYFPEASGRNCSSKPLPGAVTSSASLPVSSGIARRQASNGSTVVIDGFTFTSPSLYVEVVGTASVHDSCGPLGPVLTSATVAVPSGGLSTVSYDIPSGNFWNGDPSQYPAFTKQLNVEDLACPTWGLSNPITDPAILQSISAYQPGLIYRSVGPPYNPLVVPPKELLAAAPEWKSCPQFLTGGNWVITYNIFDPPYALTPVQSLGGPATSPAVSTPAPPQSETQASPASSPTVFAPVSATAMTTPSPAPTSAVVIPPQSSSAADPVQPSTSADPAQSPTTRSGGLGGIIISAFTGNGPSPASAGSATSVVPAPSSTTIALPPAPPASFTVLTLSGVVVTTVAPLSPGSTVLTLQGGSVTTVVPAPVAPTVVTLSGGSVTTVAPNAPVSTVLTLQGGSVTTLAPTFPVPTTLLSPAAAPSSTLTIASQPLTLLPSAVLYSGSTFTAGGPALTLSGEIVSVAPSGSLVLSAVPTAGAAGAPSTTVLTVDGKTLTAEGSAVEIVGATLTAGGPGVTVSGEVVSVASGGGLVVGSQTVRPFTGRAGRREVGWAIGLGLGVVVAGMVL
ncbi:hypothetical protein MMC13_007069 [Lambiella insularis]|nr:hypothetical protein [Lambiella insularis]